MPKTFEVIYYKSLNNGRGPGYEESHRYSETWEVGRLHCPWCGKQSVWEDQGGGDIDAGPNFMCSACAHHWTMNYAYQAKEDSRMGNNSDWQRYIALKDNAEV